MKTPLALALAAIAAPVLTSSLSVASPTIVAIDGQAAPDGNGTINFISNDFGFNNLGEVVYETQYTGLSDGRVNEKAIIVADGSSPERTVARGGFTVPQDGFQGLFRPRINDASEVLFLGFINDTAGGDSSRETLLLASPSDVYTAVAVENTDFPGYVGAQSPAWYRDFSSGSGGIGDPDLAGPGRAVFASSLTIGSSVSQGLFRFDGSNDQLLTYSGFNAFGLGTFIGALGIDADDSDVFAADISTFSGRGIVTANVDGSDSRVIAQGGDALAGTTIDVAFDPSINSERDVVFTANLDVGVRALAYYDHSAATLSSLVANGDALPSGPTLAGLTTPRLNDAGVMAFRATVNSVPFRVSILTYDIATGTIAEVVSTGDMLAGETITSIGQDLEINNSGQIAFDFRLADGRDGLAVTAATAAPCVADVTTGGTSNGMPDGAVTLSDFSFYLSLWAGGDAAADLTTDGSANGVPDGSVTLSDFSFYLSLWSAGCP